MFYLDRGPGLVLPVTAPPFRESPYHVGDFFKFINNLYIKQKFLLKLVIILWIIWMFSGCLLKQVLTSFLYFILYRSSFFYASGYFLMLFFYKKKVGYFIPIVCTRELNIFYPAYTIECIFGDSDARYTNNDCIRT